jgi:hypothetical protein
MLCKHTGDPVSIQRSVYQRAVLQHGLPTKTNRHRSANLIQF